MPAGIYVRLPADVLDRVQHLARHHDLSAAAWMRGLVVAATDQPEAARPSRRRRSPPTEHIRALVSLQEAVAELGGALVRTAVRNREHEFAALRADAEALIPAIRTASRDLIALIEAARR